MKIRNGFVSNSSSSSFVITNKTKENKTLLDFARETLYLLEEFKKEYDWYKDDPMFTEEKFFESVNSYNIDWEPKEKKICDFGDEDGTTIGNVYDYMLRDGGKTKSFSWKVRRIR